MTGEKIATFLGITPYLYYEDAAAALDWLARVFGFEEIARYRDAAGVVKESEMRVGEQEIWINGAGPGFWEKKGHRPDQLILVWVDGVDAHYHRVKAAGVQAAAPEDKPYAVRMYTVTDLEGYQWGFMQRLDMQVQLEEGWQEVLPDGTVRH
jgi:uncharacterized glyoxalase superfamily protein PhnB